MTQTLLLPAPRQIEYLGGNVQLAENALIVISGPELLFEAQTIQQCLLDDAGLTWPVVAGRDYANTGLLLAIDTNQNHPQGYRLTLGEGQISIYGADAAGVFYGICTLRQLLQQHGAELPLLDVADWPDYPARGIMLDISRDKVPTLQTVLDLVDRLAGWKINQLQLYMEHTFAYQNHPEVWALVSPFTGQDIMVLDAFCHQRRRTTAACPAPSSSGATSNG